MKVRYLRDKEGKKDESYVIAKDGSFIKRKKITRNSLNDIYLINDYYVTSITINGNNYNAIKICHLQWLAWKGIIPKKYVIHHKDFNKKNDHIDNLECIPRSMHIHLHKTGKNHHFYGKHHSEKTKEKMRKSNSGKNSFMYGKHLSAETKEKIRKATSGEKNYNSKLSDKEVEKAKYYRFIKKWTYKKIADKFKVSSTCIRLTIQGRRRNYYHLSEEEIKEEFMRSHLNLEIDE